MITDEKLMRSLMRTTAYARRHPLGKENKNDEKKHHPLAGKGFGHILDLLIAEDGVSQQQLADEIGIRPQSISEAIATMEGHGFVRRELSTVDKRVMLIYVTEQGKEHHRRVSKERSIHAKNFFSALDEAEKEKLFDILEKLNQFHNEKRKHSTDTETEGV